jgi:hypothetical protein
MAGLERGGNHEVEAEPSACHHGGGRLGSSCGHDHWDTDCLQMELRHML